MIDTVVLNLEEGQCDQLTEADSMPWQLHSRRDSFKKFVNKNLNKTPTHSE